MKRLQRHRMDLQDTWMVTAITVLLLVTACGGNGTEETTADTVVGDDAVTETDAPASGDNGSETAIEPQTFTIGHEAWHSGFHLTFGDGVFVGEQDEFTNDVDYFVTIDLNLENLSDTEDFLVPDQFALVSDGNAIPASLGSELPSVPGGLASSGSLTFIVDENFDSSTSVLLIGYAGETRAEVPMGDGEPITLEPSTVDISGSIELQLIDVTFTGAELSYDSPTALGTVDEGLIALTIHFDVLSRRDGNWSLFGNDFALIGPEGAARAPDASMIANIPGSEDGFVTPDNSVTFVVPDPPSGEYTLRLTIGEWFVGEDGVDEGTLEFSLP